MFTVKCYFEFAALIMSSLIRCCTVGFLLLLLPVKTPNLQSKAICIISNCDRRTSITPYYHRLRILKIAELYKFEIAKIMRQPWMLDLLLEISSLFKPLSRIHNRFARSVLMNHLNVKKFLP